MAQLDTDAHRWDRGTGHLDEDEDEGRHEIGECSRELRESLRGDIDNEDFTISRATYFNAAEVTPGVLYIFIHHHLITTA